MKKILQVALITLAINANVLGQNLTWNHTGALDFSVNPSHLIKSICFDASNNVYTAGGFTNNSGKFYVEKWGGTVSTEVGGLNGLNANGLIRTICSDVLGNIYAGGNFTNGSGSSSGNFYVAKWNGVSWSELGGLNSLAANGSINSICADSLGNVYASGGFINSSQHYYVAKWNGSNWSEVGGLNALSANLTIFSICTDNLGNLYAAGEFTNGVMNNQGRQYVAKWNGSNWSELGGLNSLSASNGIYSICTDPSGNLYAACANTTFNGLGIYRYNGSTWTNTTPTNNLFGLQICSDALGNVYVVGNNTNTNGNYFASMIAGGIGYVELGGNNSLAAPDMPTAVAVDNMGRVFVASKFSELGGGYTWLAYYGALTTDITNQTYNSITLFPNPTTSSFNLNNTLNKSISITNITGQIIYTKTKCNNSETIDISTQPAGIYFLKTIDENGILEVRKVVKE